MKINLAESEIELQILSPEINLSAFTCGNEDLDDFLKSDALFYQEVNIAQTVLLYKKNEIVGYFSLTSDSIVLQTREKKSFLKEYHQNVYNLPAIKIARMAISTKYQGKGIGREIVKYVEGCVLSLNKKSHIGCRFITVDAYPQSITFYQKLGFMFNKSKVYREKEHPSMRLDVYRQSI